MRKSAKSPISLASFLQFQLVGGVGIGMHENDRHATNASLPGSLHARARGRLVQLCFYGAIGAYTLGDFMDGLVEQFRLDDLLGENFRASLIANCEGVAEAFGDD